MMNITGLSRLFKWENFHNWWLTKYFFAPLYIYIFFVGFYGSFSIIIKVKTARIFHQRLKYIWCRF